MKKQFTIRFDAETGDFEIMHDDNIFYGEFIAMLIYQIIYWAENATYIKTDKTKIFGNKIETLSTEEKEKMSRLFTRKIMKHLNEAFEKAIIEGEFTTMTMDDFKLD